MCKNCDQFIARLAINMDKEEARILHGLYFDRKIIGKSYLYKTDELYWLINTPFSEGKKWRGENNNLKTMTINTGDFFADMAKTGAEVEKPLSYLQNFDYITYVKADLFSVSVTGKGAFIARELDTFWGKLNLIFKNNKDGVLWFLATISVSLITTLIFK